MNAIELLREQFKGAHEALEGTMKDVTKAVASFNKTQKALPVGAAYAHAVITEDICISTMLANKKPLSEGNGKTGLSAPMPSFAEWDKHEKWAQTVKVDVATFRKFAQKVYKATDAYLASLKEKDLEKAIDLSSMGAGKQNVAFVLNNFILLHLANLTGEVSAAKGFQGKKGYPF